MASQPRAAASVSRIQAAVFALTSLTSAPAVLRGPCRPHLANSSRISPDNTAVGRPSACAVPSVRASPSRNTSCPALRSASPRAASGRTSPSVP